MIGSCPGLLDFWGEDMKLKMLAIVAGAAMALSGCATITRGTNTTFTVETMPSGATVATTNGYGCLATPCTFKMPRKSEFTVTITKPGYKTYTGTVVTKVAGAGGAAMAGNVLVGGLIGAGVDASSGAMLDLVPNPMKVTLEPEGAAAPASAPNS